MVDFFRFFMAFKASEAKSILDLWNEAFDDLFILSILR